MEKVSKVLIMFVGKTHSGKTTFANDLKMEKKDFLIIEADPIAVFMREKFPELRESDDLEHNGFFDNVSLKYKTFLLFVEFSMAMGRPIILSNSNMWQKGRTLVFELCKKFGYKTIGVYFDFPEDILSDRVKISDRSTDVLRISKSFQDLIINQRSRMQIPKGSEFDNFLVVKSVEDLIKIKEDLIKM